MFAQSSMAQDKRLQKLEISRQNKTDQRVCVCVCGSLDFDFIYTDTLICPPYAQIKKTHTYLSMLIILIQKASSVLNQLVETQGSIDCTALLRAAVGSRWWYFTLLKGEHPGCYVMLGVIYCESSWGGIPVQHWEQQLVS